MRLHAVTKRICVDIGAVSLVVASAAKLPVEHLILTNRKQLCAKRRHQRKRTVAGFCLHGIRCRDNGFAVYDCAGHGVLNRDRIALEVDRFPSQPNDLGTAKSVKRAQYDAQLQLVPFDGFKQRHHLGLLEKLPGKAFRPRPLHLWHYAVGYVVFLYGVFQRLADADMVLETVLNDFGKHVNYQKEPMELPANEDGDTENYKDWNDKSTRKDNKYGQKIGSSAPFDIEVKVKMLTDTVMKQIEESILKKN